MKGIILFEEELTSQLGHTAKIDIKQKSKTIILMDLDENTADTDVVLTLSKHLNSKITTGPHIRITKPNNKGQKLDFVTLPTEQADFLTSRRSVGEGWYRWRVKELENDVPTAREWATTPKTVAHIIKQVRAPNAVNSDVEALFEDPKFWENMKNGDAAIVPPGQDVHA
ncbi:hypothetical protein FQR65_LT04703 [Abscondita terminalis]|nr:hypothetical protein FQR65_LT04703 [Abscondita terminalis]